MILFRRETVPLAAGALASWMAPARGEAAPEEMPLWPGTPPGGGVPPAAEHYGRHGQIIDVRWPRLILHRPARPNGTAVIIAGGGGYAAIELGKESGPAARLLASEGITACELVYRLPIEGWPRNATFADGARAVRLVRDQAPRLGCDPARVGLLGFSAGAHLAGMTAVGASNGDYTPVDTADRLSSRPDFAALIYPVLTMMPPWNTTNAFRRLLGDHSTSQERAACSVERQVNADCPPIFLAQAADDPVSPVQNSTLMAAALLNVASAPELHIFRRGGHGWGLGSAGSEVAAWPGLFTRWAARLV